MKKIYGPFKIDEFNKNFDMIDINYDRLVRWETKY